MGLLEEFTKFLEEYGVLGLAIAFVIGNAVSSFVKSTVNDIIMPVVELFLPAGDWKSYTVTVIGAELKLGSFLAATLDFLIIALLVFLFVKYALKKEEVKKI